MSETIIIALITGVSTAIPSMLASILATKRNQDLLSYKINDLTDHVNKHNNLIDRMYKIENRVTILEEND